MKKLLILGGTTFVIPAIETAHQLGIYVITCDYLPDNPAHKFSDEYHNVSTIDKDAVLKLARKINADGIISFASDAGCLTAAYVAEKMGLPGNPYDSVEILQNKGLFRKFLKEHGFNVPEAKAFAFPGELLEAKYWTENFPGPFIVKPTDSAGSKGVEKIIEIDDLEKAAKQAVSFSREKRFIIEQFVEPMGYPSDTDCFSIDSKLVYCSFNNQLFDKSAPNPFAPAGFTWPAEMDLKHQKYLRDELARLIKLLDVGTAIYNVETRVGKDGKPYIMECSPRAGGNRLAEVLKVATGQDLIKACIQAAVGMEINPQLKMPEYKTFCMEIILHSTKSGVFKGIKIDEEIKKYISDIKMNVEVGETVNGFCSGSDEIGTVLLAAREKEIIENIQKHIENYLAVEIV